VISLLATPKTGAAMHRFLAVAACASLTTGLLQAQIGPAMFRHHYIVREAPGGNAGMGAPALADFDRDGDLDYAFLNRADGRLYWFEYRAADEWVRHPAGSLRLRQLGSLTADVDGDGAVDIVVGGYWFRNPGNPRREPFERYRYDSLITSEIHDMVLADMDGDGRDDIVVTGDREGCFWYKIPGELAHDADWPRTIITLEVRDDRADIHAGLNPAGVGDLDGDGDADVFLTDRWLENTARGTRWIEHRILFGRKGPWGLSARSWITDVDGDGDHDIVAADCDGQNSGVAWLENDGARPPHFKARYLANAAPGTRGSFHSLRLADFDGDGDADILVVEQEDPKILPRGAGPRWFIWENLGGGRFVERVIFDGRLGGHDVLAGDVDGDGDIDLVSKIWNPWRGNANGGRSHADYFENLSR